MIAISTTDYDWFEFLRSDVVSGDVNFWTPTPWNVRRMKPGERLYFLLKSPIRKIGGFGVFASYQNMTVREAWERYGTRNGVATREALAARVRRYAQSRSTLATTAAPGDWMIGCIELVNAEFFDDSQFVDPEEVGLDFPRQVVKLKYFPNDTIADRWPQKFATSTFDLSAPAPSGALPGGNETPGRRTVETQRIVRLTEVGRRVKALHDSTCQVCGVRLETDVGPYAEAAHIRPLGRPHDGPDTPENVLCLCANCHVLFDKGAFAVGDNLTLVGARSGVLRVHEKHNISLVMLAYHHEHVYVGAK